MLSMTPADAGREPRAGQDGAPERAPELDARFAAWSTRLHAPHATALEPERRRAAVAIVLHATPRPSQILLMRRAPDPKDRWSGQVSLPGGHVDPGDVSLLATAQRETREEVGVDLQRSARALGRLPDVQAKARGKLLTLWITPFVFACHEPVTPVPGVEASEAFWFPIERAAHGELASTRLYQKDELTLKLPAWDHDGRIVWGLTYEMLTGFVETLGLGGAAT